MKVSIYSESPAEGPGGAEQCVAVLAEALKGRHEVEVVHHKPDAAARAMGGHFGCDLEGVKFRHVPMEVERSATRWFPWTRATEARRWRRELSAHCDVFVAFLHNRPPFCHAPRGVLISLFPTFKPGIKFPKVALKKKKSGTKAPPAKPKLLMLPSEGAGVFAWERLHRRYNEREWSQRLDTYTVKMAISEFSRAWMQKRWGCDTGVLYPPVRTEFSPGPKETQILSVGRFASTGHSKRQPLMLECFGKISHALPGWRYRCVGGLTGDAGDQALYRQCQQMADGIAAQVEANVGRDDLKRLYERSVIFWHAAGHDHDEVKHPEDMEHFGITTVEAMAAGCVPVVINKGGQKEIVEHGVSGFLWDTPEQLMEYTRTLAENAPLRERMAVEAARRAVRFSRETFVAQATVLVEGMGEGEGGP